MDKTIVAVIKTVRPRQWLKNLTLYAGLVFTHKLFSPLDFTTVTLAFFYFCLAASCVYIFNDLMDAPQDRLHPYKRKRPIAAGALSPGLAYIVGLCLLFSTLILSFSLSARFFIAIVAYFILQICYSRFLKKIIIFDVIAIASGFLLRIYAGVWVIGTHLNIWFLLCVVSFALFIAVGKRRAEATLLSGHSSGSDLKKVRETLGHYPETLLHAYTTMFATATWVTYSLFAFQEKGITPNNFFKSLFYNITPRTDDVKWLMVTVPFVIYGVMRYLYLIYEKKEGESPERILLSDKPLLVCVVVWALLVFFVLYFVS